MQFFYYLCSEFMDKKRIYHIIEWVVALAALGYLIYRMAIYEDYATLWATMTAMSWQQIAALLLCVALMPVNMSLEAWRWKTLLPMSWREAHRQVYYSKLAGLITPWRLGEYPARGLLMAEERNPGIPEYRNTEGIWSKVLSMGAVGSATMTFAIVLAGLGSLGVLGILDSIYYYLFVSAVLVLLVLALVFAPRLLRRWAEVSHKLILVSVGQSLVRLLCWCVQLALVVWALGGLGDLGILGVLGKSAVYYLLVTITPNVPIIEVGVRGAWAITLFGSMNAALAGVLLWGINTLLPCLIWPFLRKNNKKLA